MLKGFQNFISKYFSQYKTSEHEGKFAQGSFSFTFAKPKIYYM